MRTAIKDAQLDMANKLQEPLISRLEHRMDKIELNLALISQVLLSSLESPSWSLTNEPAELWVPDGQQLHNLVAQGSGAILARPFSPAHAPGLF